MINQHLLLVSKENITEYACGYLLANIPDKTKKAFTPFIRNIIHQFVSKFIPQERIEKASFLDQILSDMKDLFPTLIKWLDKTPVTFSYTLIDNYVYQLEQVIQLLTPDDDDKNDVSNANTQKLNLNDLAPVLKKNTLQLIGKKNSLQKQIKKLDKAVIARFNNTQLLELFRFLSLEIISAEFINFLKPEEFNLVQQLIIEHEKQSEEQ